MAYETNLFHRAAVSADYHPRYSQEADSYRTPYRRDADCILQSNAYSRYVDKTQVIYLVANDHISHRAIHVQLVSSLARGIAEVLRLNASLVEAIALGHDVGHPPFGHEGEGYLSALSVKHDLGIFAHAWQSCRQLSVLEPLNLGLAVYDGILCHDGGMSSSSITPRWEKTWADHEEDLESKLRNPETTCIPTTLEGCLVKVCDTISYLARDLEDAISLGIIRREQIPQTSLGSESTQILRIFAEDVISCSMDQECISMSDSVFKGIRALRTFSQEHIYFEPRLKVESEKIQRGYGLLVEYLLEDLQGKGHNSYIWKHFLHDRDEGYLGTSSAARQVIDYVAGMTDGFFLRTLQKIFVPSPIGWTC